MVWCGVVWCGVVWCGVVWCGVVWCGVVWCGVITVGDIYGQFPGFNPKDMIALMNGRTDFDGSDTVSLSNIASYNGSFASELSVFVAEKEGKSFTNMLPKNQRITVNAAAGISETDNSKDKKTDKAVSTPEIPMDTSIFDIAGNETRKMV